MTPWKMRLAMRPAQFNERPWRRARTRDRQGDAGDAGAAGAGSGAGAGSAGAGSAGAAWPAGAAGSADATSSVLPLPGACDDFARSCSESPVEVERYASVTLVRKKMD